MSRSHQLTLKKFSMDKIKFDNNKASGPTIVLIGKRNTGKSFLVRDILYYHQDVPVGTVISGTEEVNKFYGSMIPKIFIHYEYSSYFIENLMKRQKQICKTITNDKMRYGRSNIDGRAFAILDDCLYNSKIWSRDTLMQYIFMNGRHLKIMLMITMQYPLGIPPNMRCNIDYVFILRTMVMTERVKIYNHYAGMFPSFEAFCQIMDSCTDNYECIVIDNTVQSNKLEDIVFWYKADDHNEFRLGNREFWEMSKHLTDDDTNADQPLSTMKRKTNQPTINVHKLR